MVPVVCGTLAYHWDSCTPFQLTNLTNLINFHIYRSKMGCISFSFAPPKGHTVETVASKNVRKQRRKEIELNFGKKRPLLDQFPPVSNAGGGSTRRRRGCRWTLVFDPAGRFAYWWSCIVSIAFVYNFWTLVYRFSFDEVGGRILNRHQFGTFLHNY